MPARRSLTVFKCEYALPIVLHAKWSAGMQA
jgi:hypothetical protein